ncbi:hypothetical protein AA309_26430 [Microvirga vignae]|uniref:Competence protein CoiA n=1 Tax=Microvirga vignae TaxID=1225564 RepID=A0A0H1R5B8_9HYPH|nr:hypothetical protein [Microvirga vignae]KLK90318.1 hypothetical protein AA309_26430 [Microvirga vignae]
MQSSTAAEVRPLTGFACRDGRESLVFGERVDGTMAHISEVTSGLECNCVCPGCGTRLVARKGNKQDHHFGHHGVEDGRPCQTGPETALHKFAKEVLARRLELELPPLVIGEGHSRWVGYPGGTYHFDAALLESKLGAIVPDVIVRKGDRHLLVEFLVTHACDEAKIARIGAMDVAAIEIDLSGLPRDTSRADLEEAILTTAPRKWLHNPKLRAAQAEREKRCRERDQVLAQAAAPLRRAYVAACAEIRSMRTSCPAYDRIVGRHLAYAVGIEVPGIGCFTVPPRDWQALILADAMDIAASGGKGLITTAGAMRKIRQRGWLRRRFSGLTEAEAAAIRADGTSFDHPANAVAAWATTLSRLGILLPAGAEDRWIVWQLTAGQMRGHQTSKRL